MRWKSFPQGLLLVLVIMAAVSLARAAVFIWDGGGADSNLGTAANWLPDGAPPNDGTAALVFSGATGTSPNVNGNWSVLSVTFASGASAFSIGGSQLTIGSGGVTNSGTTGQTINDSIVMGAAQTWNASAGALTFGGATINTSGSTLTLSGTKAKTISSALTSAGTVHIAQGSVNFGGTFTNSGSFQVDAGTSATVSQPYTASGSIT